MIHRLALPRVVVRDLVEVFQESELANNEEEMIKIFGKPPYTFYTSDKIDTAAPLHEFGRLKTSQKSIERFIKSLPQKMQDLINESPRGYHIDQKGRYYKIEDESINRWTILLPKGNYSSEKLYYPDPGEAVSLKHGTITTNYIVEDIGTDKKATAIIILIKV